jgi:Tol biopolymer transport system component
MALRRILGGAVTALCLTAATAAAASGASEPSWIVFSAQPNGTSAAQLYRVQTDGNGLQQITQGKTQATDPAFSGDGKQIVFVRLGSGIFRVNLDGTGLRRLTSGARDSFPVWSPNGKQIAFLRIYRTAWVVYVMSPNGGGQRRLPLAPPSGRPSWTADGKALLLPTAGGLMRAEARRGRVEKRFNATGDLATSQAVTVSPDAKTVAYVGRRPLVGPSDCGESPCPMFGLFTAGVSGGKPRRIANDTGPAGWSPDGTTLIFVARGALTLSDIRSGKKTTISSGTHAVAGDAPPAWQP